MFYRFEIWYDSCCITSDSGFETEDEAYEEAEEAIKFYLEDWTDTSREDYEIIVEDYFRPYVREEE